ncbi:hypothetical protein C0Q70_13005 [Pomacea canaliculata]|uniref:Ig-like domain-containing protein n=1 Tax=Pomacea canaliculata TaxID=400727 RepID=A0A2T7P345_POMCA|nr:hypothetical protein C0Q70_13005 [Pomacea canaliculata]
MQKEILSENNKHSELDMKFMCLGNETSLLECDHYGQNKDVVCGFYNSVNCNESIPHLRILYNETSFPLLDGSNLTLECEITQSGELEFTYLWFEYSRKRLQSHYGKYLIFNNVTKDHIEFRVYCAANYGYNGLDYLVASDVMIITVCCAPSTIMHNTEPTSVDIHDDKGYLTIEMTAYPIPQVTATMYLGPVLTDGFKGILANTRLIDVDQQQQLLYTEEPLRLRLTSVFRDRPEINRLEIELETQHAALYTNVSMHKEILSEHNNHSKLEIKFLCLGNETSLLDCDLYGQKKDVVCGFPPSINCNESLPYLRILYNETSFPPLDGSNITLECEITQSGESEVTYLWFEYSRRHVQRYHGKYLIFNVTGDHHGLRVYCAANYWYNGLRYNIASDTMIMTVCCVPSISMNDQVPPSMYIHDDKGYLKFEMTAYPIPQVTATMYLGPVLTDGVKERRGEIPSAFLLTFVGAFAVGIVIFTSVTVYCVKRWTGEKTKTTIVAGHQDD